MTRYGMRTPRHSLAAAPAMAIAAGLLALWPAWAGAAAKDVKIGLVYPTTGVAATLGQAMVNGHILALE